MRKEVVWKWYHSKGLPLSYSRWDFQTNQCRPHPARGLKLLREPCFYYLQTIIVSQYRHTVGLRHSFHIEHLFATTVLYIFPDICEDGNDRLTIINLFKLRKNSYRYLECRQWTNSDVWIHHVACKFHGFFHKNPTQYRYWETIIVCK
jgi:hypothetical protein